MTRHPLSKTLATSVALVVAGFVAIVLGQRVAARTLLVPQQVSGMVSGALGGLALIAVGCVVALVQVGRWVEDQARRDGDVAIDLVAELTTVVAAAPRPERAARVARRAVR